MTCASRTKLREAAENHLIACFEYVHEIKDDKLVEGKETKICRECREQANVPKVIIHLDECTVGPLEYASHLICTHTCDVATPSLFEVLKRAQKLIHNLGCTLSDLGKDATDEEDTTIRELKTALDNNAAVVEAIEKMVLHGKVFYEAMLAQDIIFSIQGVLGKSWLHFVDALDAYDKAVKKEPEEQVGDYAVEQINKAIDEVKGKDLPAFDNVDDLMADLNDDDEAKGGGESE